MKKREIITVFLLLISLLVSVIIPFVPFVPAESAEEQWATPSTITEIFGPSIVFEEFSSYIRLNFTALVVDFYKASAGYNVLYDHDGDVVVYEERQVLQYWTGNQWKQRGVPVDLSWVKVNDYQYNVTRHYQDWADTWYNVTFVVRSDSKVKSVISIDSGQTDEYRLLWQMSGIVHEDWNKADNRLTFGLGDIDYEWIGFDWSDVYESFGDITTTSVETSAQGKKANIYFNVGIIEAGQILVIDPSTVISGATVSTGYTYQRETFYTEGRYWVFYYSGTYLRWKTSTDGISWSAYTNVREETHWWDVFFDGTYFHYAAANTWGNLKYRRGNPNSDGTITWTAAEVTAWDPGFSHSRYVSIAVDTNGYGFISWVYAQDSQLSSVAVVKSETNDGTWGEGVRITIDSGTGDYGKGSRLLQLTDGKMYVIYWWSDTDWYHGKLWGGSSWGGRENINVEGYSGYCLTAVADGDDIYFAWKGGSPYHQIYMKKRTYGVGWGSLETVQGGTLPSDAYSWPTLTINASSGDLYCFYGHSDGHIYYNKRISTWGAQVDWIDESTNMLSGTGGSFYELSGSNSKIGVVYQTRTVSPYYLRFASSDPPTITSATITDMDDPDADNVYAMKKYYTFQVVVNDPDGATDIRKVYLRGKNGAAVLWEVRADGLTGTPSWSIQSGSGVVDLDTGSCVFGEAGDVGTATFKIRTEWDHVNVANLELAVYVEDSTSIPAGWTDMQTNYWDAINRLVISNFATNATHINQGDGIDLTGTVYYATTVGDNTASSSYPPNAQFTAVHAHNAAHSSHGSDTSIVNGAFSIEFTVPDASVVNVYHVYLNMAGDYTDADAPDDDTVTIYAAPTITSATISDMDDTDNLYAMKDGYYTFVVDVNDEDGAVDIASVYLQGKQGGDVRFEVRATNLDTTPAWAIQTGDNIIDLDGDTCSWGEVGDVGTATFKIQFEWDYTQEADIELAVYVEDKYAASSGFTVMQTDYADIITRLVTTGFVGNATYVVKGEGIKLSGSVRYATTIGGNTPSNLYPPGAQFTSVDIHDAGDVERGTDGTIVNGMFSIEFTIPDVVQTNVYHVYLDLIDPYTDADAPDGDTVTVYGISAPLLLSFDDEIGGTAFDVGGSNNHGAISGATRTGEGYYGRALSFDGTDDYVNVTDSNTLDISPDIAICVWIKTSDPSFQGVLTKTGAYGLSVISNFGIRMTINTTHVDTGPNVFNSSEWTFITGTFDGTNVNISVNAVLDTTQAIVGVIATNTNHVFIGNITTSFFNGTIDEVRVLSYLPTQSQIAGLMIDIIAIYPYNLRGSITGMEATDWVFAGAGYDFVGTYVGQNATYPLDTVQLRFTDGVSWTTMIFDIVSDDWEISSVAAYLVVHSNTTSGNEWIVTWEIYLTENIFDALNVDISMYCNDTSARVDTWEVVEVDYFNIYNHGGMTEIEKSGDGISVAGEGVFGLAAQNSSEPGGSWAFANATWRKFQHVNFLVHWWQGTVWDGGNLHWDCPSEHAETGYVEYGINYWYDGSWLDGWKVRLEIVDGAADTNDAWVKINATWYNRNAYVKHDVLYAYYEAHTPADTSTQFALFVDLWVGIEGGSSTVGGRVNAEYFGLNKTGWGPWATWGPMKGLEDESVFLDDLLDTSGIYAISAEELEMFSAWALINKTDPNAGAPDCDYHQWGLIDYSGPYWRTLSPTDVMRGINAPMPTPTITPGEVSVGFFAALITAMIEGITKPIVAALGGGAATLYFIMSGLINSAFQFFIPGIDFVESIKTMIGTYGGYFLSSMINLTTIVVQVFAIITRVSGFLLSWLTRMVSFFFHPTTGLFAIVGSILDGTSTAIGGLTDMWSLMNINAWIDAIPIFIAIGWFDSIDKRARRVGGGWMSFFIGDLQMVSWVLSFLVEWFTRVIEFVINRVLQFINILPI